MRTRVRRIKDPVLDKFLKKHKIKSLFIKNCNLEIDRHKPEWPKFVETANSFVDDIEAENVKPTVFTKAFIFAHAIGPYDDDWWFNLHNQFHKLKTGVYYYT